MNRQARAVYLDELEHPHPRTRADRVVVAGMWVTAVLLCVAWWTAAFVIGWWVGSAIGRWWLGGGV